MQADALANELGRDQVALDHLAEPEDDPYPDQAVPFLKLHERCQRAEDKSGGGADVGHEHQQAGDDPDGQEERESGEPQADGIENAHNDDHQHLTVQILAERLVGVPHELRRLLAPAPGHEAPGAPENQFPVAHQIELDHGH